MRTADYDYQLPDELIARYPTERRDESRMMLLERHSQRISHLDLCDFGALVRPEELVVYGGTASGVMTAYSAAREGLHVVLLEPGAHLGGMVTGGLSATDLGHFSIIGGYAREFYMKAAAHYGIQDLEHAENWLSEPHVDEEIFNEMLKDSGVEVVFNERLREKSGVEMRGKRIVSIATEDWRRWRATMSTP